MKPLNLIATPHSRQPWGHVGDDEVLVHTGLGFLTGKANYPKERLEEKKAQMALYDRAKFNCDHEAAAELVAGAIDGAKLEGIVDLVSRAALRPIIVFPHPSFDDDEADGYKAVDFRKVTNAIPFAFAAHLAQVLDATIENSVVQCARVGRTKLKKFPRFLWQPRFQGPIVPRRPYIIVDDVVSQGGTLAALRCHILNAGGTILCCTALAHQSGQNVKFAIARDTLDVLEQTYGPDLGPFWKGTIGHEIHCLTEHEAAGLIDFGTQDSGLSPGERLQRLGDRLAKAAAKGE